MFRKVSLAIIRSLAVALALTLAHSIRYGSYGCADYSQHNRMTYTYCCVYSARLLMMDRDTVRNM